MGRPRETSGRATSAPGDFGASCIPPGVESAGETWIAAPPGVSAPHADSVIVAFYRTSMVLTCYWKHAPHP